MLGEAEAEAEAVRTYGNVLHEVRADQAGRTGR
jgi:hypothetical protein